MEKNQLVKAFDSYGDLSREIYFAQCYDTIPSVVALETPLKAKKENMDAVLAAIPFDELNLKPVFKNWNMKDARNADPSLNFPYQWFFKSEKKPLTLWLSLNYDELEVEFHYGLGDPALEEWVMKAFHHLRTKFGENDSPVFKVLSRNRHGFETEDVRTEKYELNIADYYNDDFLETDSIIVDSMEESRSGLILLHGRPGTGKTSYIKHLISSFHEKSFIFIQHEFINQLLLPEFISFLLNNRNAVLIIEDAEKVITSREYSNESSVVSTILQLTDGLFSDYLNIKIICTFNTSLERVDKALLRKGRMIANYEFKALTEDKAEKLMRSLGHEGERREMVLADIFNYHQKAVKEMEESRRIGF